MSVYLTTSYQDIAERDALGDLYTSEISLRTDFTIVPGIVALGITEGSCFTRVHMTAAEAMELAQGLIRAVKRESKAL
jgi:hypothetical protein